FVLGRRRRRMVSEETVLELRDKVRAKIDFSGALSDDSLMRIAEEIVFEWCERQPRTASGKVQLIRRLLHSFRGLDILQPLMEDPSISEIMINHHAEIFVERRG